VRDPKERERGRDQRRKREERVTKRSAEVYPFPSLPFSLPQHLSLCLSALNRLSLQLNHTQSTLLQTQKKLFHLSLFRSFHFLPLNASRFTLRCTLHVRALPISVPFQRFLSNGKVKRQDKNSQRSLLPLPSPLRSPPPSPSRSLLSQRDI
jgi:hypothetical protein